jgi:UDP-glucose 4-epimerase
MNQILQGKPMAIFGDGEQQRAFSYIGDIAPIIARAPIVKAARNRIFNIGAAQPYTVNELAREVAKAMEVEPKIIHFPPRNEVYIAFSDHSACQELFGPIPQTLLEEGLNRMAAWVKAVGSRKSKKFESIEISQGLPEVWLSESAQDEHV